MKKLHKTQWLIFLVILLSSSLLFSGYSESPVPDEATDAIWPGDILAFTPTDDAIRMEIPAANIDVIVNSAKAALDGIFTPVSNNDIEIQRLEEAKARIDAEIDLLKANSDARLALLPHRENCYKAATYVDTRPHSGVTQTGEVTHGW